MAGRLQHVMKRVVCALESEGLYKRLPSFVTHMFQRTMAAPAKPQVFIHNRSLHMSGSIFNKDQNSKVAFETWFLISVRTSTAVTNDKNTTLLQAPRSNLMMISRMTDMIENTTKL